MFQMYKNPEATGWLGWFEDSEGVATACVALDRTVLFAFELYKLNPLRREFNRKTTRDGYENHNYT